MCLFGSKPSSAATSGHAVSASDKWLREPCGVPVRPDARVLESLPVGLKQPPDKSFGSAPVAKAAKAMRKDS